MFLQSLLKSLLGYLLLGQPTGNGGGQGSFSQGHPTRKTILSGFSGSRMASAGAIHPLHLLGFSSFHFLHEEEEWWWWWSRREASGGLEHHCCSSLLLSSTPYFHFTRFFFPSGGGGRNSGQHIPRLRGRETNQHLTHHLRRQTVLASNFNRRAEDGHSAHKACHNASSQW